MKRKEFIEEAKQRLEVIFTDKTQVDIVLDMIARAYEAGQADADSSTFTIANQLGYEKGYGIGWLDGRDEGYLDGYEDGFNYELLEYQ